MALGTPVPDLSGKRGTEPVPPETHRLVADAGAVYVEKIVNVAKRERKAAAHHHSDRMILDDVLK